MSDNWHGDCWEDSWSEYVEEVLAPVPSYEEWKQLHKFLEEFNALEVAKENQQLKELLSKCLDELAEFNNSYYPETQELFSQIVNAIGEK